MSRKIECVVGWSYRNSAGQVRKIIEIQGEVVRFEVTISGAGSSIGGSHSVACKHGKGTCLKPGSTGWMKRRSFTSWAMCRCYHNGKPFPIEPRESHPRTGRLAESIRELFRQADAMSLDGVDS